MGISQMRYGAIEITDFDLAQLLKDLTMRLSYGFINTKSFPHFQTWILGELPAFGETSAYALGRTPSRLSSFLDKFLKLHHHHFHHLKGGEIHQY